MRLRGKPPKGGFKSGCQGGYWRLEQRLGGNVWRVQSGWRAVGGRTEATGRADHHAKQRKPREAMAMGRDAPPRTPAGGGVVVYGHHVPDRHPAPAIAYGPLVGGGGLGALADPDPPTHPRQKKCSSGKKWSLLKRPKIGGRCQVHNFLGGRLSHPPPLTASLNPPVNPQPNGWAARPPSTCGGFPPQKAYTYAHPEVPTGILYQPRWHTLPGVGALLPLSNGLVQHP